MAEVLGELATLAVGHFRQLHLGDNRTTLKESLGRLLNCGSPAMSDFDSSDSTESESLVGKVLVASKHMRDPNFFQTVVLIIRHSSDGALGLVVNRPSGNQDGA